MRKLFLMFGICAMLTGPALAQDAPDPSIRAGDAAVVVQDAGARHDAAAPSIGEIAEDAGETAEAIGKAVDNPNVGTITAAIIAGLALLVSLVRRFGRALGLTSKGIKGAVLGLSALSGGAAVYATGVGWIPTVAAVAGSSGFAYLLNLLLDRRQQKVDAEKAAGAHAASQPEAPPDR